MKFLKIVAIASCFISKQSVAQNCSEMLQFKDNVSLTLTNYKSEEKITGKIKQYFSKVSTIGAAVSSHVKSESFDKKDKLQSTTEFDMKCEKGIIYMDMKMMVPSQTTEAYENMEMQMSGNDLEIPTNLSVGEQLKDARLTMDVSSNGVSMATISFLISDRKVEAKEAISTPAGSFECYVISYHFKSETTPVGLPFPIKINGIAKQWFSYDAGAVKTESFKENGKSMGYTLLTEIKK